ncbi:hypothetical protein K504DRAFT_360737, partial [Pleomassaria siparia CBS 279.74]
MLFIQTLFAGAAFVAAVAAKVEINEWPQTVEAGKTYEVTYSPADGGATTFILRQGANADLTTVKTLTTSATGGKFSWKVDDSVPNSNNYALEVIQSGTDNNNYIGPIALSGSDATSSTAPSSSAVPSSSVAHSSSAVSTKASASASASAS